MITEIIQGIAAKLKEAFGADTAVYMDDAGQGLQQLPCFCVQLVSQTAKRFPSGRIRYLQPFNVLYFPKEAGDKGSLYSAMEKTADALAVIDVSGIGLLRGSDTMAKITDGAANVLVSYNLDVRVPPELPYMEELHLEEDVKGVPEDGQTGKNTG